MHAITKLKSKYIAGLESLVADLERQKVAAMKEITRIRSEFFSEVREFTATEVTSSPIQAIEEAVPAMPHGFSFADVWRVIQLRYRAGFRKQSVRGAFRSYMHRADCEYEAVPSSDGTNRYGKRGAKPFPKQCESENSLAPHATGERVGRG